MIDQLGQPVAEDVAGDPEVGLEVLETPDPEEGVAEDQQGPTLPHHAEGLGDRAGSSGEVSGHQGIVGEWVAIRNGQG